MATITGSHVRLQLRKRLILWIWQRIRPYLPAYLVPWQPEKLCPYCLSVLGQQAAYCPTCGHCQVAQASRHPSYATERMPTVEQPEPMTEEIDTRFLDRQTGHVYVFNGRYVSGKLRPVHAYLVRQRKQTPLPGISFDDQPKGGQLL